MEVYGSYGYLLDENYGMLVFDCSDPVNPIEVASLPLSGVPWDLCFRGNYAYVSVFYGLNVIDIADPLQPRLVGSVPLHNSIGLTVKGSYVFITDYTAQKLYVVDVSSAAHPEIVAELNSPGGPWDVAITGNLAVVTTGNSVMTVDVTDPVNPHRLGSVTLPWRPRDLALAGENAFIAAQARLFTVNFSDPLHPTRTAEVDVSSENWRILERKGCVFIARQENGVSVYDVTDPAHPTPAGHLEFTNAGWAMGLAVTGDILYAVDMYHGLHILNVAQSQGVLPLGSVSLPNPWGYSSVDGSYAYVVSGSHFIVSDLTTPTSPEKIADLNLAGTMSAITCEGGKAYVAGSAPFRVFDVENPSAPVLAGEIDLGSVGNAVDVQDQIAFVSCTSGIKVVDARDPAHLTVIGTMPAASDLEVHGEIAYTNGNGGLQIFDVSDPAHPTLLSSLDAYYHVHSVTGDQEYAYLGEDFGQYRGRVEVVDIREPSDPRVVAQLPTLTGVRDLEYRNGCVWVAELEEPVLIIDVTRPEVPRFIGMIELVNHMGDITWDIGIGDRIGVGSNDYRLLVLPCNLPISPFPSNGNRPRFPDRSTVVASAGDGVLLEDRSEASTPVYVGVFDASGRLVREMTGATEHSWDLLNSRGERVVPGVYFARFEYSDEHRTTRVIVLR